MVGEPSEGLGTSSFLTSLVPRQVMLESRSVIAAAGDKLAANKSKKRGKGEQEGNRSYPAARAALLRAIAAFLEGGGFPRTLAALRSEAQLEIDDGSKTPVVNLEEIICAYLESIEDPVVGNITGPEEQDAQDRVARKEEEGIHDHSEEPICKKKKKKAKGGNDNVKTESDKSACKNGVALPNQLEDKLRGKFPKVNHETAKTQLTEESKDQKRKKSKKASKESIESIGNETSEKSVPLLEYASTLLDESNVKSKDKKKKNKLNAGLSCEVVNQDGLKTSQAENSMGEDNSKSKDKKKRMHNLVVESSGGNTVEVQNKSKVDGRKKGKSVSEDIKKDANAYNLKIENNSSSPNAINLDKKAKKRKRSTSEETDLHVDNDAAVQEAKDLKEGKNKEETGKLDDSLLNSEIQTSGKKKKAEKSEDNAEKSANTPVNKQSQVQKDANETPAAINRNVRKNEMEGNGSLKSKKAELKRSAEPKTVNAFQRVKIYEVKFADEKLQDNSYWAKDGAESGYGAKAQEVLGQVRGRDFRHEKTKKKRGSYRGGQIDFQSHSVKFQSSDDEE